MKKKMLKITIISFVCVMMLICYNNCFATSLNSEMLEEFKKEAKNINIEDIDHITEDEILEIYDDVTQNYTTEDIAEIIEENKEEIKKQGISEEVIDAGTEILKTTDTETVREIIKNDIDINDIKEKIEEGYAPEQILKSIVSEIPVQQKANIAMKLFITNKIVQTILKILVVLFIYDIILRWRIYKKAGEHSWAAMIPIYRDIVMYKISGISPWIMLFWFVPILGWLVLFCISIVRRVGLACNFGRNGFFAIGNIILPIVFESIIAFHPNIKYEVE